MDKKEIYTIPNLLSLIRLFLIVPILVFIYQGERNFAFILCFLSILTDNLDGYLARKLNQTSDLGRMMDPVIDKLSILFIGGGLMIWSHYDFPAWFFLFILIREIVILIGGSLLLKKKAIVVEARRPGKMSAMATGLAILIYIPGWQPYALILLWSAFLLSIYSTIDYAISFYSQIENYENIR